MDTETTPRDFHRIDWPNWKPEDVATLLFVFRGGEVLLIHKKRGLGAGKINGPGGRVEAGETVEACAIREVEEELGITPTDPTRHGQLDFQFVSGYGLRCHVYAAAGHTGTPVETDEAVPLWTPINEIPYDRMWADDRFWLPKLFEGRDFSGRFLFDDDTMLGYELDDFVPPL
ncbi:MAG: 8-oxo-dGTP diphosphatase [Pseudomonadota bacterium]